MPNADASSPSGGVGNPLFSMYVCPCVHMQSCVVRITYVHKGIHALTIRDTHVWSPDDEQSPPPLVTKPSEKHMPMCTQRSKLPVST